MSTLTQNNKELSNFHDPRSRRRYLIELRIRGLREDFVGELGIELEPEYRMLLENCIDSLDRILAHYDGEELNAGAHSIRQSQPDDRLLKRASKRRLILILMRARGLYADVRDELERADQDDDEYCLLLGNLADDTAAFISGMDLLREAASC